MARHGSKSEKKSLLHKSKFEQLQPSYVDLVERLAREHPLIEDAFFSELVNFKKNRFYPKHNWFDYKHGYADDLVRALIDRNKPSKKLKVLDPFCGVGTTNLVSQILGYESIGFDVNPLATLAAKTKTHMYSEEELVSISTLIDKMSLKESAGVPDSSLIRKAFSAESLNALMQIKWFISQIEDQNVQDFFNLAYLSIVEQCSNRKKDGNGLKIVKNKPIIPSITQLYGERLRVMFDDLVAMNLKKPVFIFNDSMINSGEQVEAGTVGITITSPPYANCFDYCEVYKLELWMGGFVESYADFAKYRKKAIRSHVNSKFDHTITNYDKDVDLISNCIACFNVWNKNIPDMVRGYFDDMKVVMDEVYRTSRSGAMCYIVVANSCYRGILVPTDLLLAKIGKEIGFDVEPIIFARRIRASSQQMKEIHSSFGELMRESIIVLRKP